MEERANRIVLLSDTANGGAAAATSRLLAGLEKRESGRAEWWHFSPGSILTRGLPAESLDPRVKRPPVERAIKNISLPFANGMRRKRHRKTFWNRIADAAPPLINLHNIHSCGLNHDDLLRLPPELPLVWTMHDCWSFQPRAFEWHNLAQGVTEFLCEDSPEKNALRRREAFFKARPHTVLVAPSKWMERQAREKIGPDIRIERIPYGICGETFQPSPVAEARARLGLSPDKIWLGIAATHAYSRKGLDVFAKALHRIDSKGIGVLSWGQKPELPFPGDLELRFMGSISSEREIASLYSACDLFVCPSRSDNLPNTVLESLACGVPVIGSDAGGIPDMARPGETGWIFQSDHPESCAAALTEAFSQRHAWPAMRETCRAVALRDYSLAGQADRYDRLFRELLERPPRP